MQRFLNKAGATQERMTRFLHKLALQTFDGFPRLDPPRIRSNAQTARDYLKRLDAERRHVDCWKFAEHLCQTPVLSIMLSVIKPLLNEPTSSTHKGEYDIAGLAHPATAPYWRLIKAIANGNYSGARRLLSHLLPTA